MLTWFLNEVTGRNRHWNYANVAYEQSLLERTKQFPLAIQRFLFCATDASRLAMYFLLSPARGSDRIVNIDPRKVSMLQFQQLHHLNIWVFTSMFSFQMPKFRQPFLAACNDFIGSAPHEQKVCERILELPQIDVAEICSIVWPEIVSILQYNQVGLIDWITIAPVYTEAYLGAVEEFKAAMQCNS